MFIQDDVMDAEERISFLLRELYGKAGYLGGDGPCETNGNYPEGSIAYHKRDGIHFLGRADWLSYMDFMEKHLH